MAYVTLCLGSQLLQLSANDLQVIIYRYTCMLFVLLHSHRGYTVMPLHMSIIRHELSIVHVSVDGIGY